jgi:murein DD-endopeptidase MepM/ murein hydrolase activator NlpD
LPVALRASVEHAYRMLGISRALSQTARWPLIVAAALCGTWSSPRAAPISPMLPAALMAGQCLDPLADLIAYDPIRIDVRQLHGRVVPGAVVGFEVELVSDHGPASELSARLGSAKASVAKIDDGTTWYVIAPIPLWERSRDLKLEVDGVLATGRALHAEKHVEVKRIRHGKNRTRSARWYRKLHRKKRARGHEHRRLLAALATSANERMWHGNFVLPVPTPVRSRFGAWRKIGRRWSGPHLGADMDGRVGRPVHAMADGRVVMLGDHLYAGRTIVVDHGGGLLTQYLHLSSREVREGDLIRKGQIIGRVGRTGRVTGPHLHVQAQLNGIDVDPLSLAALDLSKDERPARWELFSFADLADDPPGT